MPPLFPWDSSARQDAIDRTKEVIEAIDQALQDPDNQPYREGLTREKDACATYVAALEAAQANAPEGL